MRLVFQVVDVAIEIYIWLVFAVAVMSWLKGFNVVSADSPGVAAIGKFLAKVTDPGLRPIRYLFHPRNGVDASPVFSIVFLMSIRYVILLYILPTYF